MVLENLTVNVPIGPRKEVPHPISHLVIKGESAFGGLPIVLVGNTTTHADVYRATAEHLSFFGDVYVPMLTSIVGQDIPNKEHLLKSYLQSQKLTTFSLIGYRYGSVIASGFARNYNDREKINVQMLTLLDPGAVDLTHFQNQAVEVITARNRWDGTAVFGFNEANPNPLHKVSILDEHTHDLIYERITLDEMAAKNEYLDKMRQAIYPK